jgi:hypothetical protein
LIDCTGWLARLGASLTAGSFQQRFNDCELLEMAERNKEQACKTTTKAFELLPIYSTRDPCKSKHVCDGTGKFSRAFEAERLRGWHRIGSVARFRFGAPSQAHVFCAAGPLHLPVLRQNIVSVGVLNTQSR